MQLVGGGADDDAHEEPTPGLVITEDPLAAEGPPAVDRRGEALEPALHGDRAHVGEVGRDEEPQHLQHRVRAVHPPRSANTSSIAASQTACRSVGCHDGVTSPTARRPVPSSARIPRSGSPRSSAARSQLMPRSRVVLAARNHAGRLACRMSKANVMPLERRRFLRDRAFRFCEMRPANSQLCEPQVRHQTGGGCRSGLRVIDDVRLACPIDGGRPHRSGECWRAESSSRCTTRSSAAECDRYRSMRG